MHNWIEYMGRWHVLVIHFPIGLLVTATLVEVVAIFKKHSRPALTTVILTCIGALGAVVAAGFGWILASGMKHPDAEIIMDYHRWGGVSTAVLSLIAGILGILAFRGRLSLRWPFRVFVFITSIVVIFTAHWGGELIYGMDYFWPVDQTSEQSHSHHHDSEDEPH